MTRLASSYSLLIFNADKRWWQSTIKSSFICANMRLCRHEHMPSRAVLRPLEIWLRQNTDTSQLLPDCGRLLRATIRRKYVSWCHIIDLFLRKYLINANIVNKLIELGPIQHRHRSLSERKPKTEFKPNRFVVSPTILLISNAKCMHHRSGLIRTRVTNN